MGFRSCSPELPPQNESGLFFSPLLLLDLKTSNDFGSFRFEEARSALFSASSTYPPRKNARVINSRGRAGTLEYKTYLEELTEALTLIFTCENIVLLEQNNDL